MELSETDYKKAIEEQRSEVCTMVLLGVDQAEKGQTKDFNKVCDRLDKKYADVVKKY